MRAFNAKLIEEFRANHGQMSGQMAGRQLLLLTTTGAKSGRQRTAVVGYRPYGDDLAIIASDNGAPNAPQWFANLEKDPVATVEVGSEKFKVRTRLASREPDRAPPGTRPAHGCPCARSRSKAPHARRARCSAPSCCAAASR